MKIKLPSFERLFVPDVTFDTDKGPQKNRELPAGEQVRGEITLATNAQKMAYLGSYTVMPKNKGNARNYAEFQYERCVRKHVLKIENLEEFGIVDGRTLCEHPPSAALNDMIQEFFLKVCGFHNDDATDEGVISEGEDAASE